MKIIRMELSNFKKVQHLVFEPNGEDRWILGKNGTGKTTIADAFYWVLTNKTSNDKRCEDDIKLKDKDGNAAVDHGLEHSVEIVLDLNGKQLTLSKVFQENWVKTRGSATEEHDGHKTSCFIDGVQKSLKDYTAFIEKKIAPVEILKMVSFTSYFCNMSWKKQRETLLNICGNISEEEIIESNEELKDLKTFLNGKTVNDFISIIKNDKKKINEQLDNIPSRIDEATKALPVIKDLSKEALQIELKNLTMEQDKLRDKIAGIKSGKEVSIKEAERSKIETAMEKIKQEFNRKNNKQNIDDENKIGKLNNQKQKIIFEIQQNKAKISAYEQSISDIENDLQHSRNEYKKVHSKMFDDANTLCPTCGQNLPIEKIAQIKEKFNMDKSSKLEIIRADGKALSAKKAAKAAEIEKLTKSINDSKAFIEELDSNIATIQERTTTNTTEFVSYLSDDEYKKLKTANTVLFHEIQDIREKNIEVQNDLRSKIDQLNLDITARQEKIALFAQYDKGQARIKELKNQQQYLATEFETLDYKLSIAELFIKEQVSKITDNINSYFKVARFKLFDQQVNGGVNPCCEAITQDGSTYSTTMSNGEKVKIGLDICITLAKHYKLDIPVFVDNAEGVTDLPQTDNQQIRLIVSTADAELKIVNPTDIAKQAAA